MRHCQTLLTAALVVLLAVAIDAGQDRGLPRSIRLELPAGADLTGLSISYFLTGPFGAFGSFVNVKPDVRSYEVDAWSAGAAAQTFKAIIYNPGYQFVLISESGFGNGPARSAPVRFRPLGSVPLSGRVTGLPASRRLQIAITYVAFWSHNFFGILDGSVSSFQLGSTDLRPDSSFALTIPDFARDPIVAGFAATARGVLEVIGYDLDTGISYSLRAKERPEAAGLPLALAYPPELQLVAVVR